MIPESNSPISAQISSTSTGIVPISDQMKGITAMTGGSLLSFHCSKPNVKIVNGHGAVPKTGYLG